MMQRNLRVLLQQAALNSAKNIAGASANGRRRIEVNDVTLRDGMQGKGMSMTMIDKLKFALELDSLGFDFIEGGFPQSNPKDQEFFSQIPSLGLRHSKVAAFGMTRRKGIQPGDDEGLKSLLRSKAPICVIVGKTWDMHITKILGCTLEEHRAMITDSIKFLKQYCEDVFYDAEHFFDGYKVNPEWALESLRAAAEGGATRLVLCDTNGGSLPADITDAVTAVRNALGNDKLIYGIHVHNDGGLAVANTLAAVQAGCTHVQGTVNGCGERCGNADLMAVIPNLRLKMEYDVLNPDSLKNFTKLSRMMYDLTGMLPIVNQPYVGKGAFAHKGGMHVHAIQQVSYSYEHISPDLVGNERQILVSEMAGHSNVEALLGQKLPNITLDKNTRKQVAAKVAELENQGWQFENAVASLELMVLEMLGKRQRFWDLHHYTTRVIKQAGGFNGASSQHQHQPPSVESYMNYSWNSTSSYTEEGTSMISDAIVKLRIGSKEEMTIAEGDGPVNALDGAMRKALIHHYPALHDIRLTDYKVRVVNPGMGTGAKVRVLGDFRITDPSSKASKVITTTGVHENIINASLKVIEDAFVYHLMGVGASMPK